MKITHIISISILLISNVSCNRRYTKENQSLTEDTITNIYARNNVSGYDIIKYKYSFGEIDSTNIEMKTSYTLNSDGNILKKEYSGKTSYNWTTKYKYEGALLVEEVSYDEQGKMSRKETYNYTKNKKTDSIYDEKGELLMYSNHYLDKLNRDTLEMTYYKEFDFKKGSESINRYDSIGLKYNSYKSYDSGDYIYYHESKRVNNNAAHFIIEEWNLGKDKYLLSTTNEFYDKMGRLIKYSDENYKTKVSNSFIIKYQENGLIKEKIYYNGVNEPTFIEQYAYYYKI